MSIDLIVTLYTDEDGKDRFMVQYPETLEDLHDVTDQFELAVAETTDGRTGFMVVRKRIEPSRGILREVHCHDGPEDLSV